MSKICGVWYFDSRPVSQRDGDVLLAALASSGYRSPREHRQPGLLLGWAAGSEAPDGRGMLQAPDGSICLWDGRIDNAKDLIRLTGLRTDCSEAQLVLNLYRYKGVEGLRHVVGDWSLCIWDAARREIVLASDFAGVRPLYYHRSGDGLYWASSLADLVAWTGVSELDEAYVASYLLRGSAPGLTPYRGIVTVPAGSAVRISADRIDKQAFWSLPLHRETRFVGDRQYEDRLLELFRESVLARMATGAPVCAELSGGLDSSSIVCMADRIRQEAPGRAPLHSFSYTHDNSPDEKFFREVERVCGLTSHHLTLEACPLVTPALSGAAPAWWEPRFRELSRRMALLGSGLLMTGQFGDFITGNTLDDPSQVTEWMAKGRLGKAAREAYAWGRSMQVPIYPILWRSLREAYLGWSPPVNPREAVGALAGSLEDSLQPALRARLAQQGQASAGEASWRKAPPGRRLRFRAAGQMLESRQLQTPEGLQHLSVTHPFAHRPLVEFMLTIPTHVVFAPGQPRRLMRRAFAGLLPQMVVRRKSKADYGAAFMQSLRPLAAGILQRPSEIRLVERGYVDHGSLIGRLEKFIQGMDCNESQLRTLLLFEYWLRSRMPAASGPVVNQVASIAP